MPQNRQTLRSLAALRLVVQLRVAQLHRATRRLARPHRATLHPALLQIAVRSHARQLTAARNHALQRAAQQSPDIPGVLQAVADCA
ncbi:MAG: hypothetical protein P8J20_11210 [Novosphingobium sp.]|nr:hypothetical protein [Novosphingobium sp.]